jgi:tyrosyl-tRNA synthetase
VLSVAEQLERICRGVDQIVPQDEFRRKLQRSVETGKPLRIKYGIDPTGIDVHLGHTVPLRKLRQFQELGHQAVLIIGNYTALVGDPSGRDKTRVALTEEQVAANAIDYLKQIAKIIDIDKTERYYNGQWFSKFTFLEVMRLMGKITVQRMLERDDFTKRIKSGTPISLHECLYPLMQGWDSVEIHADVELGGTEQLFNLMVGRDLQQDAGQEPQICVTMPILVGLDGVRRMGKSLGNYVGVGESANEQFHKIMSLPDTPMQQWFELLTERPGSEVSALIADNPMEAKKVLAADVAAFYHGAQEAAAARAEWERIHQGRQDPTDIPEVDLSASQLIGGAIAAGKLLVLLKLAPSNNEARRLIEQGGVNIGPDRTKLTDPNAPVTVTTGLVVRVGKKKIFSIRII